jgi:hypothetical protein
MPSKKVEYKVADRAKKAALFAMACYVNHIAQLSIPAAMRAKWYSDVKVLDGTLQMQVCH